MRSSRAGDGSDPLMLASAAALLFAHVLTDFVFQTRGMAAHKRRPSVFSRHIVIVAVTALACLGVSKAALAATAIVAISHAVLDALKIRIARADWVQRDCFGALKLFGADQIGHLLFIAFAAWLWPHAFAHGMWPGLLGADAAAGLSIVFAAGAGLITATRVGDLVVAQLMAGFRQARASYANLSRDDEPTDADNTPADGLRASAWIGWLERALVFLLVLLGQFNAIGFVIAAKSILRFEYARKPHQSELVIIGTLASFGWAIVIALLTSAALDGLLYAAAVD